MFYRVLYRIQVWIEIDFLPYMLTFDHIVLLAFNFFSGAELLYKSDFLVVWKKVFNSSNSILGDSVVTKFSAEISVMILANSKFRHLTFEVIRGKNVGQKHKKLYSS